MVANGSHCAVLYHGVWSRRSGGQPTNYAWSRCSCLGRACSSYANSVWGSHRSLRNQQRRSCVHSQLLQQQYIWCQWPAATEATSHPECSRICVEEAQKFDHITLVVYELHWLPVHQLNIPYQVSGFSWWCDRARCLNRVAPQYLADHAHHYAVSCWSRLWPVDSIWGLQIPRSLSSSEHEQFSVPWTLQSPVQSSATLCRQISEFYHWLLLRLPNT